MLKISNLLSVLLLSVVSNIASAALITSELTNTFEQKTYISYAGLDWTWASPVNTQFHDCAAPVANPENYLTTVLENSGCTNQLLAPTYREGWRYLTGGELDTLLNVLTVAAFIDFDTQTLIQSAAYWNTEYTEVDYNNFELGFVASNWASPTSPNNFYETFYVRDSQRTEVPEPSMLFLFSLALIALAARKKLS